MPNNGYTCARPCTSASARAHALVPAQARKTRAGVTRDHAQRRAQVHARAHIFIFQMSRARETAAMLHAFYRHVYTLRVLTRASKS